MRFRSLTLAAAAGLALCCTGCDVSNFDTDGDGYITLDEVFAAAGNFFCGPDSASDDPGADGGDSGTDGTGSSDDGTGDPTTPTTPMDPTNPV